MSNSLDMIHDRIKQNLGMGPLSIREVTITTLLLYWIHLLKQIVLTMPVNSCALKLTWHLSHPPFLLKLCLRYTYCCLEINPFYLF